MDLVSQIRDWLVINPWLNVISLIVAILGVTLAVLFYFKGRKVKSPCYSRRSTNIVKDLVSKIESLEMSFAGKPIRNLTVTRVAFWNAGSETINVQDVAKTDPLRIQVENGYEILDARVVYVKNKANRFSVVQGEGSSNITVDFEYLDKDEGAVIQVLHTGMSNKDVDMLGTLKGVRRLDYRYVPSAYLVLLPISGKSFLPPKEARRLNTVTVLAFFLLMMLVFLIPDLVSSSNGKTVGTGNILLVGWAVLLSLTVLYSERRRIPKGFDIFEEEF